jgi:hypothetical protein
MAAQVTIAQRTQNRIRQRVHRRVSIRMSPQPMGMTDLDSAEDQSASLSQGVEIEALPDPETHENELASPASNTKR